MPKVLDDCIKTIQTKIDKGEMPKGSSAWAVCVSSLRSKGIIKQDKDGNWVLASEFTEIPDQIKSIPKDAQEIWLSIYNAAMKKYKNEGVAHVAAWDAVKNKFKQVGDKWVEKKISTDKTLEEIVQGMKKSAEMSYPISVDELKFTEGKNTTEIQVLPIGNWNHPMYGKITINEKDLEEFTQNFGSSIRKELPITEGHSVGEEEKPAIGWFKQLINKGRDGLWAVVEWTKEGMELVKNKAYKYFSPEFYTNYEDPETRKSYKNVLVGGALTNRPYFKGLQAVILSELILAKEMELEEILKKEPTDLTDEEVKFVKEHEEELTDEQKETLKDVLGEGAEETDEEKKAKADAEAKAKEEADAKAKEEEEKKKEEEEKEASEKVVITKKALKFIEIQAKEGVEAMARWRKAEADGYVKEFTFSETNPKGKFLPKTRDKVVDFLLSLSEKQQKAFKDIVVELPQANLFSELGKDSGLEIKATDQINKLVQEKMSKDTNLEYRQALEQVFAENPDLQVYSEK